MHKTVPFDEVVWSSVFLRGFWYDLRFGMHNDMPYAQLFV